MAQRTKRLTKREKKAIDGSGPSGKKQAHDHQHIHCVSCGRHLDGAEFETTPPAAMVIRCDHGSQFPSCVGCEAESRRRIALHDATGQPLQTAPLWH